jgi:hypothetical protein
MFAVPLHDQLVEVVGLGGVECPEGEVVDDQHFDGGEAPHLGLQAVVQPIGAEPGEQLVGTGIHDGLPAPDGDVSEGGGQVGLADSERSSTDGGRTWRVEPALNARATNNGEYTFTFQRSKGDIRCGPLQSMVFSPVNTDFRLAVTFPGGLAFTRNAGQDWFNVGDDLHGVGALAGVRSLRDLYAYPYSAYLTGRAGEFRLYVALLGRGLVRIDTALRTAKPPS